jgi:Ca2+-binding EF-hand superfamily protein
MQWILTVVLAVVPMMLLADGVPQVLISKVERNPDKYLDDLAMMIAGYGRDGAIDLPALQNMVAMERAQARASAVQRVQVADLDGDGAVTGDEMRVKAGSLAAQARGRLIVYFGKADHDADDQVTADELRAYADLVASEAFSEEKAAAVFAILGFDGNGDGQVTLAEAKAAVNLMALGQGGGGKVKDKLQVQGDNDQRNQHGQRDQPAGRAQGAHLVPVGGEHDQRHHREAELQA